MPRPPLSTLPLAAAPYLSRVTSNYPTKNYYMLAFNPGYALQAAELNEIQELFHLNQSLSNSYGNSWLNRGYDRPGFWEGIVPFSPSNVEVTDVSTSNARITCQVTVLQGWYLWTDKIDYGGSGLSFWIYNDTIRSQIFTTTSPLEYIGLSIRKKNISCCQTQPCDPAVNDDTLRDNFMEFTCGSSRLGLEIRGLDIRNNPSTTDTGGFNFYPLLRLDSPGGQVGFVRFNDAQNVITSQ